MSTVDLTQWLTAQLDEDEQIARAVQQPDDAPWKARHLAGEEAEGMVRWDVPGVAQPTHADPLNKARMGHIAAHDPARVLREVEAKRGVVAAYLPPGEDPHPGQPCINYDGQDPDEYDDYDSCSRHLEANKRLLRHDYVLRLLALPYADRDGYQEGWAP